MLGRQCSLIQPIQRGVVKLNRRKYDTTSTSCTKVEPIQRIGGMERDQQSVNAVDPESAMGMLDTLL